MEFSRQEYWSKLPFPSPGESSQPRNQTGISCITRQILYCWPTWEKASILLNPASAATRPEARLERTKQDLGFCDAVVAYEMLSSQDLSSNSPNMHLKVAFGFLSSNEHTCHLHSIARRRRGHSAEQKRGFSQLPSSPPLRHCLFYPRPSSTLLSRWIPSLYHPEGSCSSPKATSTLSWQVFLIETGRHTDGVKVRRV